MIVSTRRHKQEVGRLTSEVQNRDKQISALEKRAIEAERTRHNFLEEMRYVIEAGGEHVNGSNSLRGEHLKTLAHVLPYLLDGRRNWNDQKIPEIAESAVLNAKQLATEYGFSLPNEPELAVQAMLDIAKFIFNPKLLLPLQGLRNLYPISPKRV